MFNMPNFFEKEQFYADFFTKKITPISVNLKVAVRFFYVFEE